MASNKKREEFLKAEYNDKAKNPLKVVPMTFDIIINLNAGARPKCHRITVESFDDILKYTDKIKANGYTETSQDNQSVLKIPAASISTIEARRVFLI